MARLRAGEADTATAAGPFRQATAGPDIGLTARGRLHPRSSGSCAASLGVGLSALIADELPARTGVELGRLATTRLGKTVIDAEGICVRAGTRVLLDDVN